jgi:integrase
MPDLVAVEPESPLALSLTEIADQAEGFAHASKSKATRRAYAADLRDFTGFCYQHGVEVFPASPQTVALYLTQLAATKAVATIARRMVAIARAHKDAGHANPVADPHVRSIVQGIRRTKSTKQRKKDPLTGDRLREALASIDGSTLKGKRDRAMFLLAWFTAARRSEIAALDLADLRFERSGLVVTIRRSKTDQTGDGREIGVPHIQDADLCPVRAVQAWIGASEIESGALFRSFSINGKLTENRITPQDVARLVQRIVGKAGIDGDFAAHSLRAGYITTAASTKGVSEVDIQRVSGHRSVNILRGYVRRATVFDGSPTSAMKFGG